MHISFKLCIQYQIKYVHYIKMCFIRKISSFTCMFKYKKSRIKKYAGFELYQAGQINGDNR
jgi:hypothetical protein